MIAGQQPEDEGRIVDVFIIATWFGLVAGLLEAIVFTTLPTDGSSSRTSGYR